MAPERTMTFNANHLQNAPNINSIPNGPLGFPSTNNQMRNPPPVPPRQPVQNYSGFQDRSFGNNYYGGYGYGFNNQYRGLNSFGSYNPYGSFSNYNNYGSFGGQNGNVENRLYQYVEENTRPTFQFIETILQTFSSMTMLLDSTYFALTNSFKAILHVAESVGKLRSTVNQLFSTFAFIRFLKWLYRKIVNAGFRNQDMNNEELWDKTMAKVGGERVQETSYWSGFLMFGVFVVLPYMIHKISCNIKQVEQKGKDINEWRQCEEPMYIATALYDFVATTSDELNIKAGQKVTLAPVPFQPKTSPGWCLASNNENIGLVPYNYVKVLGQLRNVKKSSETATQATQSSTENSTLDSNRKANPELITDDNVVHEQAWITK